MDLSPFNMNTHNKLQFLIITFFTSIVITSAQNVVYVYGDVSADGDVPSGNKPAFHQMRLNDTGRYGMSQFKAAIEETGLTITEVYDAETEFNNTFLKNIDVLILASNQKTFSKEEASNIKSWVANGGGLVAWSDSAFGGHYKHVGLDNTAGRDSNNLITEPFGMYFLTDNGGGNYLIKDYTEDHFINNYNKNGGVIFRGEGVSFVRTSAPAKVLAKAQSNGLGGKLKVNKIDGEINLETDATLAIAHFKEGRILGLFDRNMFWNAGDGTQLSHSNNREFTQRIMLWAARKENNDLIKKESTQNKGTNLPPVVSVKHQLSKNGKTLHLTAEIIDDDSDNIYPEITWEMKKGPEIAIFENNNPNTKTPVITLPKKGTYVFRAIVTDGEFKISETVKTESNQ
ncbi:DUF4350 domain-containing protein [Tamlana crocina]|uniref:DUF4350 domain-containing protein n=1 Tax=Tamlana crocina TaxID=393006 RepID=A0ABX1DGN9_9FLAO|nr:DUF4350 domain-containing protein [Tamlana crocina]NJX16461.1 DUF4350 domain-containing protein [Tamlana crocina]